MAEQVVDLEQGIKRLQEQTQIRDTIARALGITPENNPTFTLPQLLKKSNFRKDVMDTVFQNLQHFGLLKVERNNIKKRPEFKLVFDDQEQITLLTANKQQFESWAKTYTEMAERFNSLILHLTPGDSEPAPKKKTRVKKLEPKASPKPTQG